MIGWLHLLKDSLYFLIGADEDVVLSVSIYLSPDVLFSAHTL